jgi:bacterioferritin (cytochrome b1)
MATQNAELVRQLNTLLRLTAHEATTARARISQATTDATRKELAENANNADRRADAIRQAVVDLGGAPDVVGLTAGKVAATAKLPLEQGMPILEALLEDLALEHQLFDRARLVKVLASDLDAPEIVQLAERLENAHGNTIQWLFTVLAETAIGGPAALAPTGLQAAAGTARVAATFGASAAATGLNKAVATAGNLSDRTTETVTQSIDRIKSLTRSAAKVVGAGRDATLSEAEKEAGKQFGKGAAQSVHELREDLGVVAASDLPIKHYDNKTATEVGTALGRLRDADDIRVVLAYERAHKNRQSVIDAGTRQVESLATELVNR